MSSKQTFARNLRREMEARGMSAKALADLSGQTPTAIGYYRKARRLPSSLALRCIAAALHVTMEELLDPRRN